MVSTHYATLCFPDALLHGSDLLHWQTLRCLSGLGLLHPENSVVSRPALRRLPVFRQPSLGHQRNVSSCHQPTCSSAPPSFRQPSLGHQRNVSPCHQPTCSSAPPSFCVSLPWVIKGTPHFRHQPTCSSAPPQFLRVSLPWVNKGTLHLLRDCVVSRHRSTCTGKRFGVCQV